jgi:hypothetical protein
MSLSVDCFAMPRRRGAVAISLLLVTFLTLAACSSSNRGVTGSVGVGIGVALTTPGSVTNVLPGQTLVISASITNDTANGGVVWSSQGAGSLTGQTPTDVTYVAPTAAFAGEVSATITATSVTDPSFYSQVTIVTVGDPSFNAVSLFPANVNVPYAGTFSISGGTQPFTWALATGSTLPPGLTLIGSGSNLDSVSGTPTTPGNYAFTIQATDTDNLMVSQNVSLTVLPQASCLIAGSFSLMVSGFRGGGGYSNVANITIDSAGVISGEQDYKDGHRVTTHEILTSKSNCINRQTNSGQITLVSATGSLLYNFSVTPPDANSVIQSARLQLIGSGSDTGSGLMSRVDPTTIPATAPTGDFAFGLLGIANQEPNSVHFASAGRFTSDASGNLSAGLADTNFAPVQTRATLTGLLSAPDANGRGTANFTIGSQTSAYVYYLLTTGPTATKMFLMNIDPTVGTPRSTGFITSQNGNAGAGAFDNTALASPSILTLWGSISGASPITVETMGRLSNANASTLTIDALLDISNRSNNLAAALITGQPYAVEPGTGRGTLTIANPTLGANYSLVFYLDGISDGYVVQQNAADGSGGLLELQYVPAGGYPVTLPGLFVGGTQFPMAAGPITLNPLAAIDFGTLTSNFTNGLFYIDINSGRGLGTLTQSGVGRQSAVLYEVSATKLNLLRFSSRGSNGNIDWMIQN